ncbi:nuclear transport factor 2 family protein [Taklimakanibacter deserti]|uniref:nuclear transport factor 2 family protein n=1 Tax=Taklimakanibacter deserti TaxID=2267839 RepID=UPI000E65B379
MLDRPQNLDPRYGDIVAALSDYFEGLHHSDTSHLKRIFHPQAIYACATEGTLTRLAMDEYFPIVDQRPSPASRGELRTDRILSIEFAGPVTAFVRAECSIGVKHFTDFLTLVCLDGEWRIIAKVFHFDIKEEA